MFASSVRIFARRAPVAVVLATTASQAPQCSRCDEPPMRGLRVAVKNASSVVPMDTGKKFMKIYFAEHAGAQGKVDLHTSLSYHQAETLLTAAGVEPTQVTKILDVMDSDKSDSVDYVEIVAYFCTEGKGSLQDKLSFFFHACDIDGSKTIEATELKEIVHQMMMLKHAKQGSASFMKWNERLYADVPESLVLHLKANELVHDVFSKASRKGDVLTEREFQNWVMRGGKEVKLLESLFGL